MSREGLAEQGWVATRSIVIATVVALVVVAAFVAALMLLSKPSRATTTALEIKLAELQAQNIPLSARQIAKVMPDPGAEHDARNVLGEAFALLPPSSPYPTNLPFSGTSILKRSEPIPEALMHDLRERLTNSDAILAVLPERLDGIWFPMGWTNGFTNLVPYPLMEIRGLARILGLKAIYEAETGNAQKAAEALHKGFEFTKALNDDALVNVLVRVACFQIMCDASEQVLNRTKLTEADIRKVQDGIDVKLVDDFDHAFVAERHMGISIFESFRAAYKQVVDDPRKLVLWKIIRSFSGGEDIYRDEDYLLFLESIDKRRAVHSQPGIERLRHDAELELQHRAHVNSVAASLAFANWSKAIRSASETKAKVTALNVALAIQRYRSSDNKDSPSTLDVLVPQYMSHVPRDPFDYRSLRFNTLPRGYVVYSIGADGIDNGGTENVNRMTNNYDIAFIVQR